MFLKNLSAWALAFAFSLSLSSPTAAQGITIPIPLPIQRAVPCSITPYLYEVDNRFLGLGGLEEDNTQSGAAERDFPLFAQVVAEKLSGTTGFGGAGQPVADFLALSGGGPWGGYGAAFLRNWFDNGDYPEFRVITGVSTGALQSTYAFLGDRESLQEMEALYAGITNRDIFRPNIIPLAVVSGSGLNSLKRLRNLLRNQIRQNNWINRVADEAAKGRGLFVGVTDLNSGRLFAADLTALASDERVRRGRRERCFAEMLVASSSVPVVFDPRIFNAPNGGRFVMVDGGVRAGSFITGIADVVANIAQSGAVDRQITGSVVVNGPLEVCSSKVQGNFVGLAERSLSLLINQNVNDSLFRILVQAERNETNISYSAVSREFSRDELGIDLCTFPSGTTDFDSEFIGALIEQANQRWARSRACAFGRGDAC